ncbi:TIGR01440 family protein [Peptostreptococcaceae bacterium oral taxon 929]|nr:TIGR01440 family protein [Peptostreptococcaceae bacterium oral taxon 929]
MGEYKETLKMVLDEFQAEANLKEGEILVVGCSTSEVVGGRIGKSSSMDVAKEFIDVFMDFAKEHKIYLAFQCCEHLNRAIVTTRECMEKYFLEEVSVVPKMHAGGSMATIAYKKLADPVVVEAIQAHAGLDIGDTFIGMHIKPVAVPVRVSVKEIGEAHLTLVRRRPKLIGGERAQYK